MLPANVPPPLLLKSVLPKPGRLISAIGTPRNCTFITLKACAWNWKVSLSVSFKFLKKARLAVLIGCPRYRLRPAPSKGEPRIFAAVGLLRIQCAALMGVTAQGVPPDTALAKQGSLMFTSVPRESGEVLLAAKQVAVVPSQYCPTEVKGRAALLKIGRHSSNAPPEKLVGSHRDVGCWFSTTVYGWPLV